MAKGTSKVAFTLWAEAAETAYDVMMQDARDLILRLKASGVATSEIMTRIETMLQDETGFVGSFEGSLQAGMNDLTSTIAQTESNTVFNPDELLVWVLDPTAKEHCGDCEMLSGEDAKILAEWEEIGLPGLGNTECDGYCKCTLIPEGSVEEGTQ